MIANFSYFRTCYFCLLLTVAFLLFYFGNIAYQMWQQAVLVISAFASKLSRKITKFSSLTKLLSVQRIINHGAYKIDLLLGCIGVVAWNDQEYY